MTQYRRRTQGPVEARAFDGSEQSAAEVIAWARALTSEMTVHRYLHHGSWNDRQPELWLEVSTYRMRQWATPGCWIVFDRGVELLDADAFHAEYEPLPEQDTPSTVEG